MNDVLRAAAMGVALSVGAVPAHAIVISQIYGGGGNTGATFTNDFVELFNPDSIAASLNGWSLQYASATGAGNFSSNPIAVLPNVTLLPGEYFLVQAAAGTGGTAALPTPDATWAAALSATAGKVALLDIATGLACNGGSTPCTPAQLASIKDLVGYGSANFYEGAGPAPALSNTLAALRTNGGCTDTGNNSTDFVTGAPAPRNSASAFNVCRTDSVPEPATLALLGLGIVSLGAARRKDRASNRR